MVPLGIGLIGLGRHGMRYAQHLLEPLPRARLVAVCRRDAAKGRAFASEHSLRFYQDFRELIAANDVQAIVVVTPPTLTFPICREAAKAGKPLLVEKPLACSGAEAREMVRVASLHGVPLMTAQTLRFDGAIRAFKDKLASVGRPRYLVLINRIEPRPKSWTQTTEDGERGVLLEIGIHLLDLVRFLTGEEIAEVRCEMDRSSPRSAESRAFVSLRTTDNLPCLLDISRVSAGRMSRAEWMGEDGQILVDWANHRISRLSWGQANEEWAAPQSPTIAATLSAFVDALACGAPMPVTGRDGMKAVEIADACYESAATGCVVRLNRDDEQFR